MKQYEVVVVDTINAIQNNQYMNMLDSNLVTRDKWRDFGVDIFNFMLKLKELGCVNILILGYEGSGKSYGLKNLNPETTKWFHADDKPPTFKGALDNYFQERNHKKPKNNADIPKDYSEILKWFKIGREKGAIVANPKVFLLGHIEDFKTTDGEQRQRLKVLGSMATKMNIEGAVSYCFYTQVTKIGDKLKYELTTQNSGFNTARSPDEMFSSLTIPNDFQLIVDAINNY